MLLHSGISPSPSPHSPPQTLTSAEAERGKQMKIHQALIVSFQPRSCLLLDRINKMYVTATYGFSSGSFHTCECIHLLPGEVLPCWKQSTNPSWDQACIPWAVYSRAVFPAPTMRHLHWHHPYFTSGCGHRLWTSLERHSSEPSEQTTWFYIGWISNRHFSMHRACAPTKGGAEYTQNCSTAWVSLYRNRSGPVDPQIFW